MAAPAALTFLLEQVRRAGCDVSFGVNAVPEDAGTIIDCRGLAAREALTDLRGVNCDVVTIGQYLQPTPKHEPIARFYEPREFDELADLARELGFLGVASGPFVRSSYNAADVYDKVREAARSHR